MPVGEREVGDDDRPVDRGESHVAARRRWASFECRHGARDVSCGVIGSKRRGNESIYEKGHAGDTGNSSRVHGQRTGGARAAGAGHVRPGITVLLTDSAALIDGKRVGLLTNQTGVDEHGRERYRSPRAAVRRRGEQGARSSLRCSPLNMAFAEPRTRRIWRTDATSAPAFRSIRCTARRRSHPRTACSRR